MASYRTHLSIIRESASLSPSAYAFRVPEVDETSNRVRKWAVITYKQFLSDIDSFATYWSRTLREDGIEARSVVGVWLTGMSYLDVAHIYGLTQAGYIPQLFSLRLPNPSIIYELLRKAHGRAIICDPSSYSLLSGAPVPVHLAVDAVPAQMRVSARSAPYPINGDATVMIFHTSGSTSGCPKLVPCSYAWWDSIIWKAGQVWKPLSSGRQDVTALMGSMCHIGQNFMLLGALQHGSCMIQATKQAFSPDELSDMVIRCGLTRLNLFPTFLATHLRASRHDPKILAHLQSLDEIFISGMTLSPEDEEWVHTKCIKITNCYGSTEAGAIMMSVRGHQMTRALRPIPGMSYSFLPVNSTGAQTPGSLGAMSSLLELVIPANSPDCPDRSLRSADGHFHTGDLFAEVVPGTYVFRGRDDDWIKTENSMRCDTKAIEDNVRLTCSDLLADCVVVGTGRPSPALLVEPAGGLDNDALKKQILRRTRHFHSRRYLHERITSPHLILLVPRGSLPRTATKGNVRRSAVEEAFKDVLDKAYAAAAQ